jgi:hypothetical protein
VSEIKTITSNGDRIEVETSSYIMVAIDISGNIVVTSADDSNEDLMEGIIELSETSLRNHAAGNIHYDEPDNDIRIMVQSNDIIDDGEVKYTDYMLVYVSAVTLYVKTASYISNPNSEGIIYTTLFNHLHKLINELDNDINTQFNKLTSKDLA